MLTLRLVLITSLLLVANVTAQNFSSLRAYERFREILLKALGSSGSPSALRWRNEGQQPQEYLQSSLMELQRYQQLIPLSTPFPCKTEGGRSPTPPSSVHKLRPGDIDVIGAMGDSLTGGNGIAARNLLQVLVDNRGMSWSIGGQNTWREFLTLPNILKEFNPDLIGYSLRDSLSHQKGSQFNVAEGGAMSRDMPFQAKLLVRRMKRDKRVDIKNHWKMVTIHIGGNDFCIDLCYQDEDQVPENHRNNLQRSLDYLQDNLPRTLVNLVTTTNLNIIQQFKGTSDICKAVHLVECPCLFGLAHAHKFQKFREIMQRCQEVENEVVNSGRYDTKEDFSVVIQPLTEEVIFPEKVTASGRRITDFDCLSKDCFHFSQKCQARAANALWNNLLEPVSNKSKNWSDAFSIFLCPTEERPYFFTKKNSPI